MTQMNELLFYVREYVEYYGNFMLSHWVWVSIGTITLLKLVPFIWWSIERILKPLPMTEFGFKGRLVYVDDNNNKTTFVSHKYELCSRPDFIYYVGWGRFAVVEYKSRRNVTESNVAQLIVEVITARSRYNITKGYVITSGQRKEFNFKLKPNFLLYRKVKKYHKIAKKIKFKRFKPTTTLKSNCKTCGYKNECFPSTRLS